jgi:Fe2+ or Zn2+ uptake regulation protein
MRTVLAFTPPEPSTSVRTAIILAMPDVAAHVESWSEHALAGLREAGFRSGDARRAIVKYLDGQDCCLSAQDVHERMREAGSRVGVASVYRVLDLLAQRGLVTRVDLGDGVARFEPSRAEGHHHHLVCGDCGRIEAFEDPELERALDRVAARLGYADAHDVVLRGACESCRPAATAASREPAS